MDLERKNLFGENGGYFESHEFTDPSDVNAKLFNAVKEGNLIKAKYLLSLDKSKINVNHKDSFGMTPLIVAAQRGHHHMVTLLAEHGADVVMNNAFKPLHAAVYSNDCETMEVVIELLEKAGVLNAINVQDSSGQTALYESAKIGALNSMDTLVEYGADVNIPDGRGMTPLMAAVEERELNAVDALLDSGANVNAVRNGYSGTALTMAVRTNYNELFSSPHHQDEKVKLDYKIALSLLLKGANPNVVDNHGKTPLLNCLSDHRVDIIKLLLRKGALPGHIDVSGENALHKAIKSKQFIVAKLLLHYDVDVKIQDMMGKTPLHLAAIHMSELIPKLIAKGADINQPDGDGNTPLTAALLVGNVSVNTLYQLGWVKAAEGLTDGYNYCRDSWNSWYYSE